MTGQGNQKLTQGWSCLLLAELSRGASTIFAANINPKGGSFRTWSCGGYQIWSSWHLICSHWASLIDLIFYWKRCKTRCENSWVHQWLSTMLAVLKEEGGLNPAEAMPATSIIYHFASSPFCMWPCLTTPLKFFWGQRSNQISAIIIFGHFWTECRHLSSASSFFQLARQWQYQ